MLLPGVAKRNTKSAGKWGWPSCVTELLQAQEGLSTHRNTKLPFPYESSPSKFSLCWLDVGVARPCFPGWATELRSEINGFAGSLQPNLSFNDLIRKASTWAAASAGS